jgi:hypothetical protein
MARLVSDVDGKIKHVLLCLGEPRDAERVASIVKAFDDDVVITIAYNGKSGESLPSRSWVWAKAFLRKELSALEALVSQLPSGRSITLLALRHDPWLWAQDLIHVSEGKAVSPSRSEKGPARSGTARHSQETSLDMASQQFWSDRGFTVDVKDSGLHNTDGGNVIVCGETVYIGGTLVDLYLQNQMGDENVYTASTMTYEKARSSVLKGLELYDEQRRLCLLALNRLPFPGHLDMIFTPLSERRFVIADMKGAIARLRLPRDVRIKRPYDNYVDLLEKVSDLITSWDDGSEVVRIPCIPPLICEDEPVNHFTSFNNILQERFDAANGSRTHRVYVPIVTVFPSQIMLKYVDFGAWLKLHDDALDVYRNLGLEVRPVPFPLEAGIGGGLRCSVKVIERGR